MRKFITQFSGVFIIFLMLAAYSNPAHAQDPRPFMTKWSFEKDVDFKLELHGSYSV